MWYHKHRIENKSTLIIFHTLCVLLTYVKPIDMTVDVIRCHFKLRNNSQIRSFLGQITICLQLSSVLLEVGENYLRSTM